MRQRRGVAARFSETRTVVPRLWRLMEEEEVRGLLRPSPVPKVGVEEAGDMGNPFPASPWFAVDHGGDGDGGCWPCSSVVAGFRKESEKTSGGR